MTLGDKLKTFSPAALLILLGFAVAYQSVDPAPPSAVPFSDDYNAGAYYAHALSYRDYLKQRGITVTVLESAGSLENVEALTSGKADVAFVQSGIVDPAKSNLSSLGSMYYEPLWVFVRAGLAITSLNELQGKGIAIGPQGSGTRVLSLQLLKENGVDASNAMLAPLSGNEAIDALNGGKLDAIFIVAAASAETVWKLNSSAKVRLLNFDRADAYTRRISTLSALTLPQGSLNLGANEPKQDMRLLAATATLRVRKKHHPALQDLLMQGARPVAASSSPLLTTS